MYSKIVSVFFLFYKFKILKLHQNVSQIYFETCYGLDKFLIFTIQTTLKSINLYDIGKLLLQ